MSKALLALLATLLLATAVWANPEPTGPWHPEITAYPRMLFDAADRDTILARLDREPYLTLMARIRSRSNGGFTAEPPDPYNPGREYTLANIARAAAFVAWIDDDAVKADYAAQALEAMGTDFGNNPLILIDGDIHIAEAVQTYAIAYDILAGTGLIEPARLEAIGEAYGGLVATWYQQFANLLASVLELQTNNHASKTGAAFAAAGMVLNQREDANKWVNLGLSIAYDVVFNIQTTDGGVIAEGPYYSEYSAVNHLPVFFAFDRLVGEDVTLQKRGFCLIGPNCAWNDYPIINPLDHPKSQATGLWNVKARMPDGSAPPLDDSNSTGYPNGVIASYYNDGLLAWDWLNSAAFPLFTTHCSELNIEAVVFYDDALTTTPPGDDFGPHFLLPDDGMAIFRSGWEADDTWAMLLAENGQARRAGGGHEHSDNLSVSLFARGESLLIDPGYIAWERHEAVRRSEHHNVPTVDGQGPPNFIDILHGGNPGNDAFIVDGLTDVALPFATGQSAWEDTAFTRTMLLPDADYAIVIDDMVSDTPREFGVLWHGQAGGNSGFAFTQNSDGATWAPEAAAVDVHVASSAGATSATTLINLHSFSWMQEIEHESLDTRAVAQTDHARFVSIALPYNPTDETPRAITWLPGDNAIAARIDGDETDFVLAQPGNVVRHYTADETGSVALSASVKTLVLRGDAGAGHAYLDGNGGLLVGAGPVWGFFGTGRVWAEWSGGVWTFEFAEEGGQLLTYYVVPPVVKADGFVRATTSNHVLRLTAAPGVRVTVDVSPLRRRVTR